MTEGELEVRKQRAERDLFVITTAEDGWRVRSAHNPSRFYLVSANGTGLHCTCPDFANHATHDATWHCKHVLAVQDHQGKTASTDPQAEREIAEERAAIQAEAARPCEPSHGRTGDPDGAQMVIKRSISPDGRIDSISIEFSFPLVEVAAAEIKSRALKTLTLQTEIVKTFLTGANAKASLGAAPKPQSPKPNGATFARLLDVGSANGQYGERLYLNVQVNGRRARFFGTATDIANAISSAGEQIYPRNVQAGMRLNLPCLVLTQESRDGRYLNVTRVLPLSKQGNGRVVQ